MEDTKQECAVCRKVGSEKFCPCLGRRYCGPTCQKHDWGSHKTACPWQLQNEVDKAKADPANDFELGQALTNAGSSELERHMLPQAEKSFRKAYIIFRAVCGEDHINTAHASNNLGLVYFEAGHLSEAMARFQASLKIYIAKHGDRSKLVGDTLDNIGNILDKQGRYEECLTMREEALSIFQEVMSSKEQKKSESMAKLLENLAMVDIELREFERALERSKAAIKIWRNIEGIDGKMVANSLSNMGDVHRHLGQLDEAIFNFEAALDIQYRETGKRKNNTGVAATLKNIAIVRRMQGQHSEALKLLEKVLKTYRKVYGGNHELVGRTLHSLAKVYVDLGDKEKAEKIFEEAISVLSASLGPHHPYVCTLLLDLAGLRRSNNDEAGALSAEYQLAQIFQPDLSLEQAESVIAQIRLAAEQPPTPESQADPRR